MMKTHMATVGSMAHDDQCLSVPVYDGHSRTSMATISCIIVHQLDVAGGWTPEIILIKQKTTAWMIFQMDMINLPFITVYLNNAGYNPQQHNLVCWVPLVATGKLGFLALGFTKKWQLQIVASHSCFHLPTVTMPGCWWCFFDVYAACLWWSNWLFCAGASAIC